MSWYCCTSDFARAPTSSRSSFDSNSRARQAFSSSSSEICIAAPCANKLLSQNVLDARHWELVGTCIRRFHDANIYHADLNAHNLLLSEDDRVYLIDFDRSAVRAEAKAWKDQNLARLHRSLTKLRSLRDNFHFSGKDWLTLHNGYDTAG